MSMLHGRYPNGEEHPWKGCGCKSLEGSTPLPSASWKWTRSMPQGCEQIPHGARCRTEVAGVLTGFGLGMAQNGEEPAG